MPIAFACPSCKKPFSVNDSFAGRSVRCPCGAQATVPRPSLPAGHTLGPYKLVKKLGDATSNVYAAEGNGRSVALKLLPPDARRSPTAAKRFLREARLLFNLDSPHVVKTFDAGEELGTLFLAMELFDGRTLRDLLQEAKGALPEKDAIRVARQIASGIASLEQHGLAHRAVRPENVMVNAVGNAKLVGLGLVKGTDGAEGEAKLTMRGELVGSPEYMAPEQIEGAEADSVTDLWSLGVTLFELLAGQRPWSAPSQIALIDKVMNEPMPPLNEKSPLVSAATAKVVEKLLVKDRKLRYARAQDVVRDLEAIEAGRAPAAASAAPIAAPVRERPKARAAEDLPASGGADALVKKLVLVVTALIVIVVLLAGLVVVLLFKG